MKKTEQDIIAEAIESLFEAKASHVGNCVKSFDRSSGDCVVPHLPYRDVSHFAVGEEGAKKISKAEFEQAADIPKDLHKLHSRPDTEYLHDEDHDVHMMYDPKKDVHHFFTKVKL